jgi:hypothetical protein
MLLHQLVVPLKKGIDNGRAIAIAARWNVNGFVTA